MYLALLTTVVETEKLHIETDLSIEKGILELISELGIRKLVMGAAADKRYSKNMNIKSKKAISVLRQAPAYCHIWFICKQHLIYTKEGTWDANGAELRSSPQQVSPNTETEQSNHLTSKSNILERKNLPNPALESQIADADLMVKELEQKITSSEELLQNYKKERDELQIERDNSLKEAEELRHIPQFSEFSFSEIEEATQNFNPSLKIGEGGYGNIYKGLLGHRQVAIKVLSSHSSQGPAEYQQEVGVLSKMRHRNLITLIGACPETWTLIYEYLPNGSLEDRLNCRDNSPPLSWQTRIRIATELCSVLIFLHTSKPHCIVHADLKPANILLDANFVSKLSDFGISHQLSQNEGSSICWRTVPKGTIPYMDPEFLTSGELTPKSDVYSFGIILLRLLTGRPAFGITKEVQYALDKGNLKILLDPLAGDWPFVQAEQLVHLALRCCDMNRKSRPDLASEVGRVLESMRASCGGSSCFRGEEVMQDPHIAADGYTYEAEAIRGWLDSGHDTSPMTHHKLAHYNLVPNKALRSAIQEWLQH
ncbi:hypothetical protein GH714_043228 [Hevea brasiliensis]|uniref:RING-type E3 ubiquitin transferase n=1 Tax=Hevea brasiliensis TaxID=3981 RepID=A0A6A6K5D7_HEVBR|nr:hypothetical protein GH714_043228 [Hevea brasiliensis]